MSKNKLNVLVSGCGGDIGQSIGKILKSNSLFSTVIGCDIHDNHAGKFIYDKVYEVPPCRFANYFSSLKGICQKERINVIIPASEPELRMLSELETTEALFDIPIAAPNLYSMQVGFDKLATVEFLKNSGLLYPETSVINQASNADLPAILKSRNGSGSKSLFVLEDEKDFFYFKSKYPDFIIQEIVGLGDQEYTCGLYRSSGGEVRQISFRRKLMGGFSGFGTIIENQKIKELLHIIALRLNLVGSINVQLRLTDKGPVVFEINPRFSSTVMFRHMMGFEDVIWSVQDCLSIPVGTYSKKENFKNFYKGFNEYVD